MSSTAGAGNQPIPRTTTMQKIPMEEGGDRKDKWGPEDEEEEEDEEKDEEDEDEEEGEDDEDEKDPATRWQNSLDEINTTLFRGYTKETWADKGKQSQFQETYRHVLGGKPPKGKPNVLHMLAARRTQPRTWLLKHLLGRHKERMEDMDKGEGPLTVAISNNNEAFIKTVLRSKHLRGGLANLLSAENGIHLAIKSDLKPELIIELIAKVTEEDLRRRDAAGLTPLHLAVEYKRCTEARLDVVKALLELGDSALDVGTKAADLSVYRYHFSTRPEDRATGSAGSASSGASTQRNTARWLPQAAPQRPGEGQAGGSEEDKKKKNQAKDASGKQGYGEPNDRGQAPMPVPGTGPRPPHSLPLAGGGAPGTMTTLGDSQDPGSRQQLANVTRKVQGALQPPGSSSQGLTPKLGALPRRPTMKQNQDPKDGAPATTKESADAIANELKLHYLRSTFKKQPVDRERVQEKAIWFLYGGSPNSTWPVLFVRGQRKAADKVLTPLLTRPSSSRDLFQPERRGEDGAPRRCSEGEGLQTAGL